MLSAWPVFGNTDQRGGRDHALHQHARFETRVVLVAGGDQGRHVELASSPRSVPTATAGGPARRAACWPRPASNARRAAPGTRRSRAGPCSGTARGSGRRHRSWRPRPCPGSRSPPRCARPPRWNCCALVGLRAVAAAGDHQRAGALGIGEAEMQRREAAHRDADDVRLGDLEPVEHVADVVARALLRVAAASPRGTSEGG